MQSTVKQKLSGFSLCGAVLLAASCYCQRTIGDEAFDTVLMNAFKQGPNVNNCVSVALIKAAIGRFGLSRILATKDCTDSGFVFQLRDGQEVRLTRDELDYCTVNNAFVSCGNSPLASRIKATADTCFAVMCKNQQLLDGGSLDDAVSKLNMGYKTPEVAFLLGVGFKAVSTLNPKKLSFFRHLVIYNFFHAAYASGGLYDEAGVEKGVAKLNAFKWKHNETADEELFYLSDIKEAFEVVDRNR